MPTDLAQLKAEHDLEAVAVSLTRQPIEAHKIACPFHADSTPSLHLYDNGKWHCFGCGKHGDVLDFIGYWLKRDAYRPEDHLLEVIDYLGGLAIRPLLPTEKRIQPNAPAPVVTFPVEQLDRWTFNLQPQHRDYLHSRGLWDETIRQFRLGWDGDRLTIPAMYRGVCYGIKRRAWGDSQPKYTMAKGSRVGLFNADVLLALHGGDAPLFVVEGEIEAMLLDQLGYPAVSSTGGAGTWRPHWTQFVAHLDKIIVIYDNDDAGTAGALQVREHVRRAHIRHWPAGCKDGGEWLPQEAAFDWLQALIRSANNGKG